MRSASMPVFGDVTPGFEISPERVSGATRVQDFIGAKARMLCCMHVYRLSGILPYRVGFRDYIG